MSWIPPISTKPTRRAIALGALSLLLLAPPVARAGPLIDYTPGPPFITTIDGSLTYNSTTGDFSSSSTFAIIVTATDFEIFDTATLSIDFTVDKSGDFVSNGTGLVLTGSVMVDGQMYSGDAANPLLSGAITAFGSDPAGPPSLTFDGFFTVQGGALSGLFGVGSTGAFLLDVESVTGGILGDFQSDFSSDTVKATVANTPEPASATLTLIAAPIVWVGARLRRRRLRRG